MFIQRILKQDTINTLVDVLLFILLVVLMVSLNWYFNLPLVQFSTTTGECINVLGCQQKEDCSCGTVDNLKYYRRELVK